MLWIALTGGIATGKTTASQILTKLGFDVVNADMISHDLMLKSGLAYSPVVNEFGSKILDANGEILRKELGKIVFSNPEKLKKLESILHPKIQKEVEIKKQSFIEHGKKCAFYDVPLLFEKNIFKRFDKYILVYAPENVQISRLMKRDSLSEEDAIKRVKLQIPIEEKREKSEFIIDNSSSEISALESETKRVLEQLNKKF